MEKIAIFDCYGFPDVPAGCPDEYAGANFPDRRNLAKWVETNCQDCLTEKNGDVSVYAYEREYGDPPRKIPFRIAVVPVDLSRPWIIHSYDGREKIWYLDHRDEWNMVKPDVDPALVSTGFTGDSCVVRG